jgi:hypothetical protein
MHRTILAIAVSTALIISGPAYAQHGHGGGKPTTSPSTTAHGNSGATTHGSSGATTHGQSGSHGPATKPTGGSTTTHGKSGDAHGSTKHADTTATTTSTSTSATTASTTLTPVQQKLQKNTNLADKLQSRLGKDVDLMAAADGFKNLGQFVAAVNVSNNLGLKFTDLKTSMVDDGMSLGQAIQKTKKTANVDAEVTKAETEADAMIKSSTTTSPTTTTKTKKSSGDK